MNLKTVITLLFGGCLLLWGCQTKTQSVDSCGDGFVDPGEDCDASELNGSSCTSLGFYKSEGVLACTAQCRYDTTDCDTARCGDSIIQPDREDCEGDNLNGKTCVLLGYERGTLGCNSTCSFDPTSCEDSGSCGDAVIQDPEQCDGNELGGQTCTGLGYYAGILTCGAGCQFDLGSCQHRCGDGMVDTNHGEACDGTNLNGQTCVSLGYSSRGGELSCAAGCVFDEGACVEKSGSAQLASLTVTSGTLSPPFSSSMISYIVPVPHAVLSTTVSAVAVDAPYATVVVSPTQPMALGVGTNVATVTVTAENGTQQVVRIEIVRLKEQDAISANVGALLYVPSGTFQRDATATNLSVVTAFRMSQYEITRAQWVAVTGWADPSDETYSSGVGDPVQNVSWYDAIAFCNKLSILEGFTPVYTIAGVNPGLFTYAQIPTSSDADWNAVTENLFANGYRLPRHMEYLWAAMGADTAAPGQVNTTGYAKAFAGSDGTNFIGDYVVFGYSSSQAGRTTTQRSNPVGSRLPNELGFHDLCGNVMEWEWDWVQFILPTGTLTDYRGAASGTSRYKKECDWNREALFCTVQYHGGVYPHLRDSSTTGFRVVKN